MARSSDFLSAQDAHFAGADRAHFAWTTHDPSFAPVEDGLLDPALADMPFPCLEVGCGEGTNLARLVRRGTPVGVDRSPGKVAFAARAVPGARLAAADALALPFRTGAFAGVLVRDLLHHVTAPASAMAEVARVLAPGGRLVLLEPNGRNPLVALQGRLIAAERNLLDFTPERVRSFLAGLPFTDVTVAAAQGLPLRRLVLHPRFGVPRLGRLRPAARLLLAAERLGERLLPTDRWSYVTVRARRA